MFPQRMLCVNTFPQRTLLLFFCIIQGDEPDSVERVSTTPTVHVKKHEDTVCRVYSNGAPHVNISHMFNKVEFTPLYR